MNNVFITGEIETIECSEIETADGTIVTRYFLTVSREGEDERLWSAILLRVSWTPKIKDREKAALMQVGDTVTVSGFLAPDVNSRLVIRARDIDRIA